MSIAGSVSFGGLGSGIDFNDLVDKLKQAELYYADTLQTKLNGYDNQIDAFDAILELLNKIEDSTAKFADPSTFIQSTVSTSNSALASVTVDKDAPVSTNTLTVTQLATASIQSYGEIFSKDENGKYQSFQSADGEPLTFSYSMGGEDITVELNDGATIEDLVTAINNDGDNPGVKASLISSGNGYVFQLQSKSTGAENEVTITGSNMNLENNAGETVSFAPAANDDGTNDGWNKLAAKDAEFYLNGFEAQILTSSTNKITGVIEGVTIDLKQATNEPITITVSEDTSNIKEAVTEWVDSVNSIFTLLQTYTKIDESVSSSTSVEQDSTSTNASTAGGTLSSNSTLRMFKARLNDLISGTAAGMDSSNSGYTMLAQLGITTQATTGDGWGKLTIDETKLDEAIKNDPQAVADLFSASDGVTNSTNFRFVENVLGTATPGTYDVSYDLSNGDSGTLDVNSVYIDGYKAQYSAETGLFTVTDRNSAVYGVSIAFEAGNLTKPTDDNGNPIQETFSMREGKADSLIAFLKEETRFVEGYEDVSPLAMARNNLKISSDNLFEKIEDEIARVDLWESRQKAKYARLEVLMSQLNNTMSKNASALSSAMPWG